MEVVEGEVEIDEIVSLMLIKALLFANPDFIIIVLESYYKIMLHLLKKNLN
jgi:hypothetical protein